MPCVPMHHVLRKRARIGIIDLRRGATGESQTLPDSGPPLIFGVASDQAVTRRYEPYCIEGLSR
jgi:hypothetical protein